MDRLQMNWGEGDSTMAEITVIITTYNLEAHIDRCFKELFAQSYQDFDIVVVDDCSKDKTGEILKRWAEQYPNRVRLLLLQKNVGACSRTRNIALDSGLVTGRYICFLDGDDAIESTYLQKLHEALIAHDADLSICGYDRIEQSTGYVLCDEMLGFKPSVVDMPVDSDLWTVINPAVWNKMYKAELFRELRFSDVVVGEDTIMLYTLSQRIKRMVFIDEKLIHYGVRAGSVINTTSEVAIHELADALLRCYHAARTQAERHVIAKAAFLHIGISMAIRAYDNVSIKMKEHLRWTWNYICDNFDGMKDNPYMKLSYQMKNGMKGMLLWGCLIGYRLHIFGFVLRIYSVIRKILHIDIKF